MKIARIQKTNGQIVFATPHENAYLQLEGELFESFSITNERVEGRLLSPLVPSVVIGIGLNYRQHADEIGAQWPSHPIVFLKFPGAVCGSSEPILLPSHLESESVDYEAELAVVLGRPCKNATKDNALDFVWGYTCANDVSARDWQIERGGSQWCRGKSFDSFCPLGPALVTRDEIPDPNHLAIQATLNGQRVQDWNTRDMIFDVRSLIEFLSADTTLPAGTVILTGTPQGVGMAREPKLWLHDGDEITITIEKIGDLANRVSSG